MKGSEFKDNRGGRAIGARLRTLLATLPVLVALAELAACRGQTPWRGIIKVAIVAPYSGPLTADGQSMLAGARLAEEEIDAAGGVDGYRILLIAPDEQLASTPADIVEDPAVLAVVGQLWTDSTDAVATYHKAGMVWLAAGPVAPGPGVYRMVASPETYYSALDRYLRRNGQTRGEADVDPALSCEQARDAGQSIIVVGDVEAVCGDAPAPAATELARNASAQQLICIAPWCDSPEVTAWADHQPYDYVAPVAAPPASAAWSSFVARIGGLARVQPYAAVGYDGVKLVAMAFQRAIDRGSLNRSAVAEEMSATRYHGLLGPYGPNGALMPAAEVRHVTGTYPGDLLFRVEDQPSSIFSESAPQRAMTMPRRSSR